MNTSKEEKKNNLVPSLMSFEKQFNWTLFLERISWWTRICWTKMKFIIDYIANIKDWQKINLPKIDRLDMWLVIILNLYSHNRQLYSNSSHKQVGQYKDYYNKSNNRCHKKLDYISYTRYITRNSIEINAYYKYKFRFLKDLHDIFNKRKMIRTLI